MPAVLVWCLSGIAAALVTRRVAHELARTGPLRRANYRGIEVPTALGIAILLGIVAATVIIRLVAHSSDELRNVLEFAFASHVLTGVLAFGLLGLWDDVAGTSDERGWRAHASAVAHGRPTSGAIKLAAGGALAFVLAGPGESIWWSIVAAATIALSANLFNLLDLRPGRCGKVFLVAAVALMIAGGPMRAELAAAIGAVAAFLPFDLRERAMLGDTGSNALGAIVGMGIVFTASHVWLLIAAVVLAALNVVGQKPGLSALIETARPLRAFDTAGRAPE